MNRFDRIKAAIAAGEPIAAEDAPAVLAALSGADRPASATQRQGERDKLYRQYRDQCLSAIANVSERVRRFQRDLAAYRDGAWQAEKHGGKLICPESIRGTPREILWQLLLVWPEAMSDRHLHDKFKDD